MDPATIRFRHSVPYALFPASPPLAALHALRARTLHPDYISPDSPSCSRCGSLLLQHPRSFKTKSRKRMLRRSCCICGAVTDALFPIAAFPPTRAHSATAQHPPQTKAGPSPPPPPKSISPVPSSTATKSRPKKKSGLQHLLARNRKNEERERQKQKHNSSQLGGLAAFLGDLS
ncbi:hypothetical protein D9756_000433 [Leucocoprinus leucothites]|uniref:Uncharacterized protein n=1 Tax=Leucocoprinus leucothites TaxID=201217 RepID=A0A8H5GF40_9AGAR|nr:hypothetical protein D9756_000433 [Leucoagaricus leucothites]